MAARNGVRRVLYSPGYGAGWTTWSARNNPEQQRFMLEYPPFVEFLTNRTNPRDVLSENHPLVVQFRADWDAQFPESAGEYPYMGGLEQLDVFSAPAGSLVRVHEYDGSESVEVNGDFRGWL